MNLFFSFCRFIMCACFAGVILFFHINAVKTMKLTSPSFQDGGNIPPVFTCQGKDINPALQWDDVPAGTKSFALSIKDPDAPAFEFVHWMVYDIHGSARQISENSVPGKEVINHFRRAAYGGPCPPSGVHRYYFRLYALDIESLGEIRSMDAFDAAVSKHAIGSAQLMAKYMKSK